MNRGRVPLFRSLTRQLRLAHWRQQEESRRRFLHLLGATGASLLGAPLLRGQEPSEAPEPAAEEEEKPRRQLEGPVAVVGGGIAGLTAALRLSQAGAEVHLYEGSERFGGRMFTKRGFNQEGMFCELGGELVDTNHEALIALCKEMGLEIQPLKEGEAGVDFYHIGGQIYTDSDLIPAFGSLASRIAADAEGLLDTDEAYTDKARQLDKRDMRSYLQEAGAGTEKWLLDMLDIAYCCEYGLDTDKQSSLALIEIIGTDTANGFEMFGESDEAHRIKGGNDGLPTAVFNAIKGKVKTLSGHQWVQVAEDGSKLKLTFRGDGKTISESYAHVICAIPFSIARTVSGLASLPLGEEKKRALAEMTYGTNLKVMWGTKNRLWRTPAGGRSVFCNGAVVSDLPFQQIWETSRGQDGQSGIITNFMGGTPGTQFTPDRLDKFPGEVDQVFPGFKAALDGQRAMMNWPSMKWVKGSYASALTGQWTWIFAAAAAAELDGRLHFAGEHTSEDFCGFMNGGVESGERAAKELLEA